MTEPRPTFLREPLDGASRRLHCRQYGVCLGQADSLGAADFDCRGCSGFAPLTPEQLHADLDPLLELACAIASERWQPERSFREAIRDRARSAARARRRAEQLAREAA